MARGPLHYKELEDMLKTFRCQDLANLLAYANHSKNGKKNELLDRCLKLLENGSVQIQSKIQEIYNSKTGTSNMVLSSNNNNNNNNNSSSSNSSSSSSSNSNSNQRNDIYGQHLNNNNNNSNNNSNLNHHHNNINNNNNNNNSNSRHISNYPSLSSPFINTNNYYQTSNQLNLLNNEIKFKKLAFYEVKHDLIKPIFLIPLNSNIRPYQSSFTFTLQSKQADEVSTSREIIDGRMEYSIQIQLRFALYESGAEQIDNFPPNTQVNVNGKPAQLPQPKPTSKPNSDIIRPGRSVDITHICKLAPLIPNKVDVTWTNSDSSKVYCVGLFIVKKLSTEILMERLVANSTKPSELSRQLVREKLNIEDNDFEIETDTLKASLLCPLMKCRIKVPGRSMKCKHVQCFDLTSYLNMNEKKPTWNCPVCDRHTPYEDLFIDGLFMEIIKECTDAEEVQFNPNGDWSRVEDKKNKKDKTKSNSEFVSNSSVNKTSTAITSNSNDLNRQKSTNNNVTANINDKTQQLNSNNENNNSNSNKKEVIIDLTLDSDEEDSEPNNKNKNMNNNNNTNNNNNNNLSIKTNHQNNDNDKLLHSPAASVISISSTSSRSTTPTLLQSHNNSNNNARKLNINNDYDIISEQISIHTDPLLLNSKHNIDGQICLSPSIQNSRMPRTPTYQHPYETTNSPQKQIIPPRTPNYSPNSPLIPPSITNNVSSLSYRSPNYEPPLSATSSTNFDFEQDFVPINNYLKTNYYNSNNNVNNDEIFSNKQLIKHRKSSSPSSNSSTSPYPNQLNSTSNALSSSNNSHRSINSNNNFSNKLSRNINDSPMRDHQIVQNSTTKVSKNQTQNALKYINKEKVIKTCDDKASMSSNYVIRDTNNTSCNKLIKDVHNKHPSFETTTNQSLNNPPVFRSYPQTSRSANNNDFIQQKHQQQQQQQQQQSNNRTNNIYSSYGTKSSSYSNSSNFQIRSTDYNSSYNNMHHVPSTPSIGGYQQFSSPNNGNNNNNNSQHQMQTSSSHPTNLHQYSSYHHNNNNNSNSNNQNA